MPPYFSTRNIFTHDEEDGQKPSGDPALKCQNMVFQEIILENYRKSGRSFPWRGTINPYHILVSEIMLQQTQVERVLGKYELFLGRFPDFDTLAGSDLRSVLSAWQGLGYNRRAIALRGIAQRVMEDHNGSLPQNMDTLMALPGIGRSTAGAILSFAYNIPTGFIETNIRRVFIHFFFSELDKVRDSEILPLVEKTLDRENPRDWYYALMDYGAKIKGKLPNPNRRSKHYTLQAQFEGSDRQIRGRILKVLVSCGSMGVDALIIEIGIESERVCRIITDLVQEGFLIRSGKMISVA